MALTKITPQMFDTSATAHDLNVDNGTFVVDASANRVGIGIATPTTKFHIFDGGTDTGLRIQSAASADNTSSITFDSRLADNTNKQATITAYRGNLSFSGDSGYGKVGIGTTSPSTTLEVRRDVAASADLDAPSVKLYNNSDGGSAIEFANGVAGKSKISFGVEGTGASTDETFLGFSTGANGGLSERMRITSAGLVGIGRTPAFASLEVEGDKTTANNLQLQLNGATDTNKQMIIGYDTSSNKGHIISQVAGTSLSPLILSAGKVGIGAASMTATRPFHVKTGFNATGAIGATFENTDTNGSSWIQLAGNGTAGSFQIGASLGKLRFYDDGTSSQMLDITPAGALLAGAGSASLPSLSFMGDPNTGIYSGAADNLYFSLGGVRKGFWSATQFNVTGNGVFSGTGSFGGNLSVTGQGDFSTVVYVGNQNSEFAENNLRFRSGGHAYIDHNTVGQDFVFRTSSSSSLDRTSFTIDSSGLSFFSHFLGVRTSTRADGGTPAYSLTMSADNSGNAIEVFRTSNSKMLQYMSADGKYYFDMYGSSTPELRFRNAGTDWMRSQGSRLYIGSATQTLGAGTAASGAGSNQTLLQVNGAVDMGYQGRYTACIWGPTTVSSTGAYTHLRTNMWGGGSPHGNAEYIMGGFIITGYRYASNANLKEIHQFHNWSGSLYNYTGSNMLSSGNGWSGSGSTIISVYVGSNGFVYIRLPSDSTSYRMFMVDYIQYSQYNKVNAEITAVTVSSSATV